MRVKTVFIAHPISGDIKGNVVKVLAICEKIHSKEIIPVAPYLVSLQYLDDEIIEDRKLGIAANLECFRRKYIDELWLYGDRISKGMEQEIKLALKLRIPIKSKTAITKIALKLFIMKSALKYTEKFMKTENKRRGGNDKS
ncbi:MAG: hypothetical protein US71_C0001G0128 [Parcubacteria group bacterium GW2011_GWD2_38_12]|nr:MAG: hypothetical protein US06_C0002G0040 [Parcubacteria group bacterium GW2011_GWC2_36_17]KKQ42743.1 MAG: hypothetical protein US61_C0021G0002 [Parcubacteria group bacterium GW2011_GWE2_37_8]KKQ52925.1 MAG: hypothetical protein US71_C0001G0128 [Parcubacteria group bacterium GW2011_GWD2_38_12]KKQ59130.1 MAG: hypothetical protein US79_C0001G0129 [Parcubacteria group bacterium GW2011_GWC1_38_17]KKQ59743.1 MAG: hypothetical protein US78_C0001G0103 [Parcubacteria group bacterium GW2011_GWD1_38_1